MQAFFNQLLDQLCARGAVLYENDRRLEGGSLLANSAFKIGIVDLFAIDVQQVDALTLDAPGSTDAIVIELTWFVGGIPTLGNAVERRGQFVVGTALEPV